MGHHLMHARRWYRRDQARQEIDALEDEKARAVAPRALQLEPHTTVRQPRQSRRNVTPVLGRGDDPYLPPGSCDLILAVNVFHHVPALPAYLRRLRQALKPRGRIVDVDFHKHELPIGPPLEHKLARAAFLKAAQRAGLRLVEEPTFLPHQYFLALAAS